MRVGSIPVLLQLISLNIATGYSAENVMKNLQMDIYETKDNFKCSWVSHQLDIDWDILSGIVSLENLHSRTFL